MLNGRGAGWAAAAIAIALPAGAAAAEHLVAADGSGDFSSIQAAIDAAASGDVLYVANGTYIEGAAAGAYGGALVIDKDVSIVGESVDGVVVVSGFEDSFARTGALVFAPGTYSVEVRSLTIEHGLPGTETGWGGGSYAYACVTHSGGYNTITGDVLVQNVVFRLPADHYKSMLYANSGAFDTRFVNVTVDFGTANVGDILYENYVSAASELRNTIVVNTSGSSRSWGTGTGGPIVGTEYSLFAPAGAPPGTGNLSGDPGFVDLAAGDYRLTAFSIAVNQGDPDPAYDDRDGTRNDMGAFGGDPFGFPADADGDGHRESEFLGRPADCDDDDPLVFPGADERCNDLDDDCDGLADEGWPDTDGDGSSDCVDEDDDQDGSPDDEDCAPLDATVYPGAAEACDDLDSDCDGSLVDEFEDVDEDGIPDCNDDDLPDPDGSDDDDVVDEGDDDDVVDAGCGCGGSRGGALLLPLLLFPLRRSSYIASSSSSSPPPELPMTQVHSPSMSSTE